MYKYNNNLLPSNFTNYFTMIDDVHKYETRSKGNLYHNMAKSSVYHNTVRISGPRFWNSLTVNTRKVRSLNSFKIALKDHLFNKKM